MLKKRIVATLLIKAGIVVQSIGFRQYLPVGDPAIAVEFFNQWGVDEIILLDIDASREEHPPDFATLRKAAARCLVPLTVGGGIQHIDHIRELMKCGADKVSFNQAALQRPDLLTAAARIFGNQCVVASIDAMRTQTGHRVYDHLLRRTVPQSPGELAASMEQLGAGEILVNSVDHDGAGCGFDIELINTVCAAVTVPVICCGGAGHARHFLDVFQHTPVSAAAAANFFHFTEHSITTLKAQIEQAVPVRHETHASYRANCFDPRGRLLKKDDKLLEGMLFVRLEKEVI